MILLPRFKSRPPCSARPIVLQIESSHRCINQHRPSCHPCSVRRFLSPELPTTLRPRRLWQATGPDVKAIRTCSRCTYPWTPSREVLILDVHDYHELSVRYLTNRVIKWSVSVSGFLGPGCLALHRVGPVYRKIVLSSHSPSQFNCQHDKVMLTTSHTTCYSAPVA